MDMTNRHGRVRYVHAGELQPQPYEEPACASCRELREEVATLRMHLRGLGTRYLDLQRRTAKARTILAPLVRRDPMARYEVARAFDLLPTCEELERGNHADEDATPQT